MIPSDDELVDMISLDNLELYNLVCVCRILKRALENCAMIPYGKTAFKTIEENKNANQD